MKPVLVTTQHRGVFAGLVDDDQDLSAKTMGLKQARMAIYWGTERGVMQLADTGPTSKSHISAPADIPMLHDITAIFEIKDEAWVKERKLYPFPVQDDMIAEDEVAFTKTAENIRSMLFEYRSQTNLPVFVAQVSRDFRFPLWRYLVDTTNSRTRRRPSSRPALYRPPPLPP